jgi:hypothetical protein
LDRVLPPGVKARIVIEQASTFGWERYVGDAGRVIGMKTFGASALLKELQKRFGFCPDRIVATAKKLLGSLHTSSSVQPTLDSPAHDPGPSLRPTPSPLTCRRPWSRPSNAPFARLPLGQTRMKFPIL